MSRYTIRGLVAFWLVGAVAAADETGVKQELAALRGTWYFTAQEVDGMRMREGMLKLSRIEVDGDGFTTFTPEGTYKGQFSVDPARSPKTIDMKFSEGPEAGGTCRGIYELEKGRWKLCLMMRGEGRPREFGAAAGRRQGFGAVERGG